MKSRLLLPLGAVAAAAACGDPFEVRATLPVRADTLTAFATVGTPIEYPSALRVVDFGTRGPVVVRAAGDSPFDVAFDIDAQGRVVLSPVRLIAPGAEGRRVGLQVSDSAFETLSRAPRSGYQYDSVAVTVDVGKTVVIEVTDLDYCFNDLSKLLFTKLVVDSVRSATREIYFRTVTDPNCGFRSFAVGTVPRG